MKRDLPEPHRNTPDSLTILGCSPGLSASKLHVRVGEHVATNSFRAGMHFKSTQTSVKNIHDLSSVLRELEKCYNMFCIRGWRI